MSGNHSGADRIAQGQIFVVTHPVLVSLEVAAHRRDLLRGCVLQFLLARSHLQAVDDTFYFDTFYFACQEFPQCLATERLAMFLNGAEDLRRSLHIARDVDDVQNIHRAYRVGEAEFGDLTQADLTV